MYVIRTQKLATWLINKGFEMLKIDDNKEDDRFKCFLFDDTPVLRAMVKQYSLQLNSTRR